VLKVWDVVETMIAPAADEDTGVEGGDEDEHHEPAECGVTGVMAVAGAVTGEIGERPESNDELFVVETHSRITCVSVCGEEVGGDTSQGGKGKKKKGAAAAPAAAAAELPAKKLKKKSKVGGASAQAGGNSAVPAASAGVKKKKKKTLNKNKN
jgi:hypothetical protein